MGKQGMQALSEVVCEGPLKPIHVFIVKCVSVCLSVSNSKKKVWDLLDLESWAVGSHPT